MSDVGHLKQQGAPARMARGAIPLPEVSLAPHAELLSAHQHGASAPGPNGSSQLPFVTACKYPTGAVSVTTLGRVLPWPTGYFLPRVDVVQTVPTTPTRVPLVGVFGRYNQLTLVLSPGSKSSMTKPKQVLAQDLLATAATDITDEVSMSTVGADVHVLIRGSTIDRVGTVAASAADDVSDPGLVVSFVI